MNANRLFHAPQGSAAVLTREWFHELRERGGVTGPRTLELLGRFLEKPDPDQITCNTINAGIYVLEPDTFDRIPRDTPYSIERSYFPSLVERGEAFVAYVYQGYWIDIGTPEKYTQVHRDIMSGAFSAAPFAGAKDAVIAEGAKIEDGAVVQGPCFIDEGTVVRPGARVEPYSVIGRECHIEEAAVVRGSIVWSGSWIGREAVLDRAIVGRNAHVGRNATVSPGRILGDKSVLTDFTQA